VKLPRDVSGEQMVAALVRRWGYAKVNQVGSHVILQTGVPGRHRIAVPSHARLKVGTLNGILRAVAAAKGVSREDIVASL
jgi:predicted RNA binding protein YcfA (HicA-like mRNA interferase family)